MCIRLPTVLQEEEWLYSEIMSFLHFPYEIMVVDGI